MAHAVRREAGPLQREVEAVYAQYDPERCGFLTRRPYKLAFLALFGCKPSKVCGSRCQSPPSSRVTAMAAPDLDVMASDCFRNFYNLLCAGFV